MRKCRRTKASQYNDMEKETLLANLNPSQREAVEYTSGPSLVIAGAGSGKTRVLTYKIAWLIESGLQPENILALTFTNKAANEMKERIGNLIGADKARKINMGTFHSVFSRILRAEAASVGFTSQFTIYDADDSKSLVKTIVKEMSLDDKTYKPSVVHNRISMAKNCLISAEEYVSNAETHERDRSARIPEVGNIYRIYQQRCAKANAMDFDDLLMMTHQLFTEHDDIRRKWADRFRFILVDEYQDTNRVQQMIVGQLAKEHHRVCVVGDDAQSIYAFRGANIDNILDFCNIYKEAKLFKLERNYRSTQRIVQAANSLIRHNERQIRKDVFSENDEGDSLIVKSAYSDKEEAAIVCGDIKKYMQRENGSYSDFAILYRTNAQSRTFEEECLKRNIPYIIYGGTSFYQRKEIKDVIAYFRLIANHDDEEAFRRIVNYPARGIGNTTVDKMSAAALQFGVTFWDVCCAPDKYGLQVNGGTKTKLSRFTDMIAGLSDKMNATDAYTLGKDIIIQSEIHKDLYSSTDPEYLTRQENLEEFLSALSDFVENLREEGREEEATLDRFLQEVSLLSDKDTDKADEARVTMMTVHSAKGLEFPTVFIVGMEENIFPSSMACDSRREMEEERRLLYVAITRAERHCILTCAKNRWRYGKMEYDVPSRFLNEIDPRYIRFDGVAERSRGIQNSRPVAGQFKADIRYKITALRREEPKVNPFTPAFRRQLDEARQKSRPATSGVAKDYTEGLYIGATVEHQRFGIGTVTKLEGTGENAKAMVEFRNTGTKQLLLKFARLVLVK